MSVRRPNMVAVVAAHALVYAFALSMLLPFLWMVLTSFKSTSEAIETPDLSSLRAFFDFVMPDQWLWSNYAEAARSIELGRFYINSTAAAVATTVFGVLYNALAGFAFAKLRFFAKRPVFFSALITMMLPMQVYFIFTYLISARLGYLDNLQAIVVPFLASGFGIFYMRQAVSSVPDALVEAARMDGMTDWEIFLYVVLPTIWPAVSALGIFTFVFSWNNFFWPLVVLDSTEQLTLPVAIAKLASGQYASPWPLRMAAATILTLPLIVVFFIFQRAFVQGVALTGIKE